MALPIRMGKHFPTTARSSLWLFMTIGAISAAAAQVIYVVAPPEWSTTLTIVAGIRQAFVTLPITLVAERSSGSHLKKDQV